MADRVIRVKLLVEAPGAAQAGAQASGALDKTAASFDNMGKSAKETGAATQAGMSAAANAAKSSSATIGSSFKGGFAQAVSGAGLAANAGTAAGLAIVGSAVLAAGAVLKIGLSYEQSMNTLQAVSGASAAKMREVGDAAKALGNDASLVGTSAGDAAQAMTELAKGGLTVDQSMKAARGTLQLAAAAQISGAQAAQIQANALNAFSLGADQAGHVADVLANVANSASGELTDFAAGLQQSAGVAASFGISIDDSATVLGLFAKNGMLGSDAGTSFKTALIALASPSKQQAAALKELGVNAYDAAGNFVGMRTVTDQLATASAHMSTEQFNAAASTAFGSDAMRAAGFLAKEGAAGYDAMSTAVSKAGGAQELAAAQAQGVTGAWSALTNVLETGAVSAFEALKPAIEGALHFVTELVTGIGSLLGVVGSIPGPFLAIAAAIAAVVVLKSPITSMFTGIAGAVSSFASGVGEGWRATQQLSSELGEGRLKTAFTSVSGVAKSAASALSSALGGPIGIAAIAGTAILALAGDIGKLEVQTHDYSGAIDELTGKVKAASEFAPVVGGDQLKNMQAAGVAVGDYSKALSGNVDAQNRVRAALIANADANKGNLDGFKDATVLAIQYEKDLAGVAAQQDTTRASLAELAATQADTSAGLGGWADKFRALGDAITGTGTAATTTSAGLGVLGVGMGGFADRFMAMGDAISASVAASAGAEAPISALEAALNGASDAASAADDSLQFFNITVQQMLGINTSAEQATKLLNDSIRATQAAFADANTATEGQAKALISVEGHIDTTTKAGSELYDGLQDIVKGYDTATTSAYDQAVAAGNVTGALGLARTAADNARGKFIEQATAAGLSAEASAALATQLGLVEGVKLTDKNFSVNAQNVDKTKSDIDAINSKTIANKFFDIIGRYTGAQAPTGGKVAVQADGGMFEHGRQIQHAANGLSRLVAGRAGGLVHWAEPETVWEAFISGKPQMRARNLGIMAETAGRLGGVFLPPQNARVEKFADGGVRMPAGMQTAGGGTWAAPTVNVAAPAPAHVQVYVDGREMVSGVMVKFDGVLQKMADTLVRSSGQTQ